MIRNGLQLVHGHSPVLSIFGQILNLPKRNLDSGTGVCYNNEKGVRLMATSELTRQAIFNAVENLMRKKSLDDLQIGQISDVARRQPQYALLSFFR